jgi:hypothetical protein
VAGKLCDRKLLPWVPDGRFEVGTSVLDPGLYLLTVASETIRRTLKFVVY